VNRLGHQIQNERRGTNEKRREVNISSSQSECIPAGIKWGLMMRTFDKAATSLRRLFFMQRNSAMNEWRRIETAEYAVACSLDAHLRDTSVQT